MISYSFNQEELKILRLIVSILTEVEMDTQEQELIRRMEGLKERKSITAAAVLDAKHEMEEFRDQYELLLAEDKALDKAFRKEFYDQDAHTVDQLYKLFKRRPR